MITPDLVAYVRQQLSTGATRDAVTQSLAAIGWSAQDIQEAFATVAVSQPQPAVTPTPALASIPASPAVQVPTETPTAEQGTTQPAAAHGHRWLWITAIVAGIVIVAGGAFIGYQVFLVPLLTPPVIESPVAPKAATSTAPAPLPSATSTAEAMATTSAPVISPPASSTPATPLPSATLTVNNEAAVTASASTFTLKWSATNADTFSATRSVAGCTIPALDTPDTALKSITGAKGTKAAFTFTKSDLTLLAGCTITVTYLVQDAKSAQQAQAAVTISFPSNATTTAALINMTSLRP